MFNKLFAVCLLVNDLAKSLDFYTGALGLDVKSQEAGFANFNIQGTELAIFQKDSAVTMFPEKYMGNGGGVVIGFTVEDLKHTCDKLKAKGIQIFAGPKTTAWGQKVAYLNDPDGNIWEISEPFKE